MPRGSNAKNLKPPSTSEARERGKKGGQKSGEIRAQRKLLRDELISLLQLEITDSETNKKVLTQVAISTALIKEALSGDVKAFVAIRDTIGEKPATVVSVGDDNKQLLKEYLEGLKK